MVANTRNHTPDKTITALIQRACARRSDLTGPQQASLASITDHRVQTYGRPGIDTVVPPHGRGRK